MGDISITTTEATAGPVPLPLPAPDIRPAGVTPHIAAPARYPAPEPKPGADQLDLPGAVWQTSTQGNGEVQIAFVEGFIAMRDGRNPEGPALVFTPGEWRAFVLGARDGEFDLT